MAGVSDIIRRHGVLTQLLIINCAVFVLMLVSNIIIRTGNVLPFDLLANLGLGARLEIWMQHPWTLLTYMFTHENFFHILFNMLWLLWFGYMFLEIRSPRQLVWIYIFGGLGGGLLYMGLYPLMPGFYGQLPILIGASASVMAIMAATAVLMPNYTLHLFFIGDVKLKWMAGAMIVLAFLGLGGGNAAGGIAHVGGVIAGLIAGVYIKKRPTRNANRIRRRNPFKGLDKDEIKKIHQRPIPHNPIENEQAAARRLDELLDKIHLSGFKSLTKAERAELEELSQKVGSK